MFIQDICDISGILILPQVATMIHSEHIELGLTKDRSKRRNHDSHKKLLAVPRYADLLEDIANEDETECGRALISTPEGWQTTMAKWVFDAQEAERQELEDADSDDDFADLALPSTRPSKPYSNTLKNLFGGLPKRKRVLEKVIDVEVELMQALAEAAEDDRPDDGAVEIDSDEEYQG